MKVFISGVNVNTERLFISICEHHGFGGGACNPGFGYCEAHVRYWAEGEQTAEDKALDADLLVSLVTHGFNVTRITPE